MSNQINTLCPCGSGDLYTTCCQPLIKNEVNAQTAEQLMRSRYTAYTMEKAMYIVDTTHPRTRHQHTKKSIIQWAKENKWTKLEILKSEVNRVVFKAYFIDKNEIEHCHYENSIFEMFGDKWYYLSGTYEE